MLSGEDAGFWARGSVCSGVALRAPRIFFFNSPLFEHFKAHVGTLLSLTSFLSALWVIISAWILNINSALCHTLVSFKRPVAKLRLCLLLCISTAWETIMILAGNMKTHAPSVSTVLHIRDLCLADQQEAVHQLICHAHVHQWDFVFMPVHWSVLTSSPTCCSH